MIGKEWCQSYKIRLSSRDFYLLEKSAETLDGNVYTKEEANYKYPFISPSKEYFQGVWNWDTAFHAIGVSNWNKQLAFDQIEGFLSYMKEDGMLPDTVDLKGEAKYHSSKPPVFPWAAAEVIKRTGDTSLAGRIYDKLKLNEKFWRTQRFDGKLFYYDAYIKSDPSKIDLYAMWETGWDNSVRWDNGITNLYPVDLNCYMYSFYDSMIYLAKITNNSYEEWEEKKNTLGNLIEETFWNEKLNAYTDVYRFTGEKSDVLSPASFMPLFIKTASEDRGNKMAEIAADKDKFNFNMPTVSYDNPKFSDGYWRGLVWINTAYFAAKGIKNYNIETAEKVKETVLDMMYKCSDEICENYDSLNMTATRAKKFSWSSVFTIEFILGI